MKSKLIIVMLMFLISACSVAVVERTKGTKMPWDVGYTGVYKHYDESEGVICYVYSTINKGGISCIKAGK